MKTLVVANWKLNPQKLAEARVLGSRVEQGLLGMNREGMEVVLCPPFVFLPALKMLAHFAKLGAQNISHEGKGAFTGEVSADQLKEFGVEYVIVGHSERRTLGEDDKAINKKIKVCLEKKLQPILCVGYGTKKSQRISEIKKIISRQLKKDLSGLGRDVSKVAVVYEPVWAISRGLGTGKAVTPEHGKEIIDYVRSKGEFKKVIYGGSLDGNNSGAFAKAGIEGGLVGGASLDAEEFLKIVNAFTIN